MKRVQFVGLDVHADTIAVAVAAPGGTVRSVGVIPNRPESIRKLVKRLGSPEQLRTCYEAGPTGYVIYWQLTALGVRCEVVAPTLVPVKAVGLALAMLLLQTSRDVLRRGAPQDAVCRCGRRGSPRSQLWH